MSCLEFTALCALYEDVRHRTELLSVVQSCTELYRIVHSHTDLNSIVQSCTEF